MEALSARFRRAPASARALAQFTHRRGVNFYGQRRGRRAPRGLVYGNGWPWVGAESYSLPKGGPRASRGRSLNFDDFAPRL
jgi:hypothetical protein